ncbi:hypothetical protein CL629_01385 [bacterium]|nr:hypothetical protein [bacterium]|tara:strand:- start:5263 stop:6543 length:1281 start_codon:yes stop_codon:yes gene_type:complete
MKRASKKKKRGKPSKSPKKRKAPRKKEAKKVLMLLAFPLWGSGSGTYARELARELNKSDNVKTAIVCPENRKKVQGLKLYPLHLPFPVAFTGHPAWPVCKLYKDLTPRELVDVYRNFTQSVMHAVDDFKPDIIHVHHISVMMWVANLVKALYGINYIATAHGTGVLAGTENKSYVPLTADALHHSKKVIPVSKDTKDWMLRTFGEEFSTKTRIIPGGITIEDYPIKKETKTLDRKYKLKGKKVVLFSGKLTEKKGVYYLVNAAKQIKGQIYLAGDGPERARLEDLKHKLELKNVHFLGYMGENRKKELVDFYYRADVFVAPSVWDEPLGLVILEAMAAKTPVIVTKKGGIPLAVKEGVNGTFVRPRNSKQVAEAVNRLLSKKRMRRKMGKRARETVEQKFTWKITARKYKRIYKQFYKTENGNGKK